MEKTTKNIIILIASLGFVCVNTFLCRFINYIPILPLRISAVVGLNFMNGLTAFAAMKLTGMKIDIDIKNKRQYLIGVGIALILSALIAFIPALCGYSLIGLHMDFSWEVIIGEFLFFLLVIGPVEEFVFRVYLQDTFVSFFPKHKWAGVVIAAFLFGLWHIINGSPVQVLFTFGIGLIFGFARYKIKGCDYAGLAVGHGLYDFLNIIVRMFII